MITTPAAPSAALELLQKQLAEIVQVVPAAAVTALRQVPLYFSPEYPGRAPTAEFHPDVGWLRANGRNPEMAEAVEFTNVRQFEAETDRMPNFTLHELAHAYHFRVLPQGFANPELKDAYTRAKASGRYDRVERRFGNGRANTFKRAYAMTDAMEYFAETTEAFFSRNDFFPFTRDELQTHDPDMFALLERLWGASLITWRDAGFEGIAAGELAATEVWEGWEIQLHGRDAIKTRLAVSCVEDAAQAKSGTKCLSLSIPQDTVGFEFVTVGQRVMLAADREYEASLWARWPAGPDSASADASATSGHPSAVVSFWARHRDGQGNFAGRDQWLFDNRWHKLSFRFRATDPAQRHPALRLAAAQPKAG